MDDYVVGDVVWVYFPFEEDPAETKMRPAIIIDDLFNDCVVIKCTKTNVALHNKPCIFIKEGTEEFQQMGLSDPTYISLTEELTINKKFLHGWMGDCPEHLLIEIDERRKTG